MSDSSTFTKGLKLHCFWTTANYQQSESWRHHISHADMKQMSAAHQQADLHVFTLGSDLPHAAYDLLQQ
jgi:hypothetical protein